MDNKDNKRLGGVEDGEESLVDVLRVEGVNAQGFGSVPKVVMKDRRLPIQAKAIYAYFCSYAGSGNRAFPGRATIIKDLGVTKDTYYKYLDVLKKHDYLRVGQTRGTGKYRRNVYILVSNPKKAITEAVSPCPKSSDTIISDTIINRDIEKDISLSIHPMLDKGWMEKMDQYSQIVKENIEYEQLLNDQPRNLAESIYLLIMDVLCGTEKTFRVNGTQLDAQMVRARLLELRYADVASVIDGITRLTEPVRNVRNYLLTALYNARATSATSTAAQVGWMMKKYHERKG